MKIKIFLTLILLLNSSYSQEGVISIEGSHTLTQESDMSLYQTIDKCLNLALVNGIYEYLLTSNDYTEEEKQNIMQVLTGSIQMCVKDPLIINQTLNGNIMTIKAQGLINPFIINQIIKSKWWLIL